MLCWAVLSVPAFPVEWLCFASRIAAVLISGSASYSVRLAGSLMLWNCVGLRFLSGFLNSMTVLYIMYI